jgi:uncharacterized damage-inducible protein DinB
LALTSEIDSFRIQFMELSAEAGELVSTLSEQQFHWRPSPDVWSIARCIDHLNATARTYLPSLDDGIADAIRRGIYAEGPFRYNWVGRLFVWSFEPPPRFRLKAPASFQPAPSRGRAEIMAAFRAYQVQFVDRLRQANGLDLGRARVRSPAARWVRMPLGSAFALQIAHERRHLWQARALMSNAGFPAPSAS